MATSLSETMLPTFAVSHVIQTSAVLQQKTSEVMYCVELTLENTNAFGTLTSPMIYSTIC